MTTSPDSAPKLAADSHTAIRDDHIYRETRWLCAIIVPFLIAAFYILYLRPTETKELFAWPISPSMSARMLAAAYVGGIFYFTRAFFAQRWHHIKLGFLPVTAFASVMGIATFLHWDKFTHDHISFVTWVILYVTTPFLVMGTWLRNRRTDPGTPDPQDVILSKPVRYALGAVGAITLVIGIILFLQPDFMISVWPWTLTPLTSRVVGGMFMLPALVGLGMAFDARWSSAVIILQSQVVSIAFILLASALSWADFNQAFPSTWLFVGGLTVLLIALPLLFFFMQTRLRA